MTAKKSKSKTLFLIDDENVWLEAMEAVLKEEHYNIVTADSGTKALTKLSKLKPDLIISDLRMPDMNGYELFDKIKNNPKLRNVPFVFMSGLDDYDARHFAKTIGVTDYLTKPFDSEEMKSLVLGLLQKYKKI
ncbi:MAG: response regulator [Bacteroidota bacterium]|nr:response regulator [Bacteroidota bacterium]